MNMRTTLMLMAATIVPAFAQQPVPATQALTQMVAPAQATTATPEQRAAVFSSLAVLPADLHDFLAFSDIAGNITRLAGSGAFPDMEVDDIPEELLAIDGAALASSKANASSYTALAKIIASVYTMQQTEAIAQHWVHAASEAVAATIRDAALAHNATELNKAAAAMRDVKIHPVYGVVTCKPGNEGMLQEWKVELMKDAARAARNEEGLELIEDMNGFSGLKFDFSKMIDDEEVPAEYLQYVKDDPSYLFGQAAEKEAATRTLYVLFKQQGNAFIVTACENPEEIKLAASPAESILASSLAAEADANLNKGMIALAHTSTELLSANSMLSPANLEGLSDAITGIFTALGNKDAANKATYDKAAAGVKTVVAQVSPLFQQATKHMNMQVWCDKDLHIQLSGDAMGMSYTPAPLRNTDKADAPSTIAYIAATPCTGGPAMPSLPTIMDAALDIAQGINLTVPAEKQAKCSTCLQMAAHFMPEAKELTNAIGTIAQGLDGNIAFVVDSAPAPLAPIFGAQAGKTASMPRMAWSFGVSDRSKLGEGWDGIISAAGKIVAKQGGDPESVGMLPIVPATEGNATTYSVSLPFFNKGFIPTLSVSDNSLVAGTSATLNSELMQTATGNTNFAGGVIVLRPAPLAATLSSLADAMDEEPKDKGGQPVVEAKPTPTVVEVEVEEDGEVDVDVENEDDYDEDYEEEYDHYEVVAPKSPQQRRAEDLREAAGFFKECGRVVDALYVTSTTENGRNIIRCDVKLK